MNLKYFVKIILIPNSPPRKTVQCKNHENRSDQKSHIWAPTKKETKYDTEYINLPFSLALRFSNIYPWRLNYIYLIIRNITKSFPYVASSIFGVNIVNIVSGRTWGRTPDCHRRHWLTHSSRPENTKRELNCFIYIGVKTWRKNIWNYKIKTLGQH